MATERPYDQLFPAVATEGRVVQVGGRFFKWKASTRRWSRLSVEGSSVTAINQLGELAGALHTFIHETLPSEGDSDA